MELNWCQVNGSLKPDVIMPSVDISLNDNNIAPSMDIISSNVNASDIPWTYYLYDYWRNDCDPRIINYPTMDTPWLMLIIMSSYLIFVKLIGPKLMSRRSPYQLKWPMICYNLTMVIINSYFFIEAAICLRGGRLLLDFKFPSPSDQSDFALRIINSAYLYYLTKYIDLIDTVFFTLRKKFGQITTLHLYHHSIVPVLGFVALKIGPTTPPLLLFAHINSLVHVIMYSYYLLSSLGPKVQPYLWWKKYLTQLQLVQFMIFGFYGVLMFLFQTGYKPAHFWMGFIQPPIFFWLFWDFYKKTYKLQHNKKIVLKSTSNDVINNNQIQLKQD